MQLCQEEKASKPRENKQALVQVQEKAAAQAEYQAAMQRRQTAILLEETTPDIFQIKVGHLSPGAGAKVGPLIPTAGSTGLLQVSLVYLSELPVEDEKIRLTIPTTVAPRYISESYLYFLLSRYVPSMDNSEEARKISSIQHSGTSPAQVKLQRRRVPTCLFTRLESLVWSQQGF